MMTAPFGRTTSCNLETLNEMGLAVDITLLLGTLLSLVHIMLFKWLSSFLRDSITDSHQHIVYKSNV